MSNLLATCFTVFSGTVRDSCLLNLVRETGASLVESQIFDIFGRKERFQETFNGSKSQIKISELRTQFVFIGAQLPYAWSYAGYEDKFCEKKSCF